MKQAENVIDLVNEFRNQNGSVIKIEKQMKDAIIVSFFLKDHNNDWHKADRVLIPKEKIKKL
jgi:hypothetical protein